MSPQLLGPVKGQDNLQPIVCQYLHTTPSRLDTSSLRGHGVIEKRYPTVLPWDTVAQVNCRSFSLAYLVSFIFHVDLDWIDYSMMFGMGGTKSKSRFKSPTTARPFEGRARRSGMANIFDWTLLTAIFLDPSRKGSSISHSRG